MDWVQDMTARWVRILSAAGGVRTPLDEAVRQISAIGETPGRKGRFGRLKRNAAGLAEAAAVTVLCRQLIAGVLVSDLMIDRLCAAAGQAREQILDELSGGLPRQLRDQQLRALQVELSGSCTLLQDPERASYAGLGTRIEQLLRLAEEQASGLVAAARAEAAEIHLFGWRPAALSTMRGALSGLGPLLRAPRTGPAGMTSSGCRNRSRCFISL